MVTVQTYEGPRHFTKVVFVWSGHTLSGWPTSFDTVQYNDILNGVFTFGHDDTDVEAFTWFIPNGSVPYGTATNLNPVEAASDFHRLYGERLVVWINPKDATPMINEWTNSKYVFTPRDLGLSPFTGTTQAEFREWALEHMEMFGNPDYNKIVPLHS